MGFKIVNASWSLKTSKYPYIPQALDDAVTEMNNNGTLLIATAGNEGHDVVDNPAYPACYPHENIIAVMSTDRNDEIPYWSNWGLPEVDIAAPGQDIFAANIPSGYRTSSGTSFSAPLVAGACALLWSKYPTMTHLQIKQLILENVDVLPSLSGKCITEGRLNIKKALEAGGNPTGPSANFSANPTNGTVPHFVQFTDTSIDSVDSWSWDFDCDGSVDSTAQNPDYTYDSEGTYSVSLTVDGPLGSDTMTRTGYITVSANVPPTADFTADPLSGEAPLNVQFTDTSFGSVDSWSWDFNLDSIVDSTAQNPNYTYNSVGTYSVSLTVSGPLGSDTITKTGYITVTLPTTPLSPTADFSVNTTSGEAPLTVQFTDTSSGSVTSWSWDFDDDGNVDSAARHPEHTYGSAGTYSVSLTVSGPAGSDTEIKTGLITVSDSTVPGVPNSTGFNIERKKSGGCSLGTAPSTPHDITGQLLPLLSLFGFLFILRLKEIRRRLMMLMLNAKRIRRL
jgi:PKD repeat protein